MKYMLFFYGFFTSAMLAKEDDILSLANFWIQEYDMAFYKSDRKFRYLRLIWHDFAIMQFTNWVIMYTAVHTTQQYCKKYVGVVSAYCF